MSLASSTHDQEKDHKGQPTSTVLPAEAGMDGPVDRALAFLDGAEPLNTDPAAIERLVWKIDSMLM